MSNLEWDVYMAILRDKSDDPSVWARNKLQQMAYRIHAITAERDEARREVSFLRPIVCLGAQTAHEYAKQRGWDCFEQTMCKEAQHDLEADTHSG